MVRNIFFLLLIFMISSISPLAWAKSAKLPPGYRSCPKINQIKKTPQKMIWRAPGGWKSSEVSFASRITKFIGAQWQGVNVGNVSCLYQTDNSMTFPVILRSDHLIYMPKGGKWSKNLGGYLNCKSNNPSHCLFKPKSEKKIKDIYKEIK